MKSVFALLIGLTLSGTAMAQEYGLSLGIHQTSAGVDQPAGSTGKVDGKLGFEGGLQVAFELVPKLRFRTGALYNQRPLDFKFAGAGTYELNYAYLDVPVNVQYGFNEMVSVFGGLTIGVKASDSVKTPASLTDLDLSVKSLFSSRRPERHHEHDTGAE